MTNFKERIRARTGPNLSRILCHRLGAWHARKAWNGSMMFRWKPSKPSKLGTSGTSCSQSHRLTLQIKRSKIRIELLPFHLPGA